jgi:hypothetical protein
MQGDLISKSEVVELIKDYYPEAEELGFGGAMNDLLEAIKMIDVAYDVEKVVAELEEESYNLFDLRTSRAIEIVRNGGKE